MLRIRVPRLRARTGGGGGAPTFSGTAASALPAPGQAAVGAFTAQPLFSAVAASPLPALVQAAQAVFTPQVVFGAVAASALPAPGQAAVGAFTQQTVFSAVAASALPALVQAAQAFSQSPGAGEVLLVRARLARRPAQIARAWHRPAVVLVPRMTHATRARLTIRGDDNL